jgi:hypothetical protein
MVRAQRVVRLRVGYADCKPGGAGKQGRQMKHRTEIEIEVSETIAYSRRDEQFMAFCLKCNSHVEMCSPATAAVIAKLTEREIYRLVESGQIHYVDTGRVLICMRSLMQPEGEI